MGLDPAVRLNRRRASNALMKQRRSDPNFRSSAASTQKLTIASALSDRIFASEDQLRPALPQPASRINPAIPEPASSPSSPLSSLGDNDSDGNEFRSDDNVKPNENSSESISFVLDHALVDPAILEPALPPSSHPDSLSNDESEWNGFNPMTLRQTRTRKQRSP